jgi:hypothetical protein
MGWMLSVREGNVSDLNAVPWNPSTGNGLYLMAQKKDEQGRGIREHLLVVIGNS